MSERPTPETDAFAKAMYSKGVDSHHDGREAIKHAKRLERERDEAREMLRATAEGLAETTKQNIALRRERDEARTWGENAKRERDNWEQTAAHYLEGMHYYRRLVQEIGETIGEAAYLQDDGGKVDSVLCAKVPELVVELKRERDEAIADRDILRIDAQREAEHHDRMVGELERVYKERDEAREELKILHSNKMSLETTFKKLIRERDELKEALLIMENLLKPGIELFPEIGEILKQGAAK